MRSGIDVSRLGASGSALSFDGSSCSWFEDISRGDRAAYISQNQIASKVHSPDSPSASKEVGGDTPSTMQALIPVFAILGAAAAAAAAAAGAQLTLLPYAYLADPLPVYHQSQDTRAGVHAYSYAGGPSAKEEVRGLDGVTRGSYSYVDAHGILQSVFYVADEGGFRVAATNLPTDGNVPLLEAGAPEVLLAKHAHSQEHARAVVVGVEEGHAAASRRKRSLEAAPADRDRHQIENPSSQGDQADRDAAAAAIASPKSSHELAAQEEKSSKGRANRSAAEAIVAPVYGLQLDSVLIPRLTGAATSHQSRVDVHNNIRLKAVQPVKTISVLSEPAYETVILPSQIPLATSHQSRVQVHNSRRVVEVPEKLVNAETIAVQSQIPEAAAVKLEPLSIVSALPDYNENRIQFHRNLGLEGPNRKDAVKIDAAQLAIVETPIATAVRAVPVVSKEAVVVKESVPVVAKEAVPVVVKEAVPVLAKEIVPVVAKQAVPVVTKGILPAVTAVSSQSRIQIHRNNKLEVAVPFASEPTVYLASSFAQPFTTWPILAPIAYSSQYRHQIHSSEKLE
ncbi:PREDICTED: uncharacterized protein LOC105458962 [Wasmannia auropunctata]|uniref:uncharacterized protein LOC105458962 n=1 Tax=Wasmannia auropunctata TaxID=64793 RepID=UPI0005EE4E51|nr:PREDICTED: uncharacterized protein LOC105458962 [Wasmannia auropunctata]